MSISSRESTRRRFLLETGAVTLAATFPLRAESGGDLSRPVWNARWISVPGAPPASYGVYYFRRALDLPSQPRRFVVHVTGDNRYQLFVNGRRVSWGPARGDLFHWRYETVDVAPYLDAGRNVFAAVVWNFGELAPEAQISLRTGFLLEGDSEAERAAGTGASWKCVRDESYSPAVGGAVRGYFAAGPGDRMVAASHPWGWEGRDFDDSGWAAAEIVGRAAGRESADAPSRWMLVPRSIPAMEEQPQRLRQARRAEGIPLPAVFPAGREPLRIPPRTHATLLLDQTFLTTAYPELTVSGGRDAVVRLGYAEALFEPAPDGQGMDKGNRNEIEGKRFLGYRDEFVPDGGTGRVFRPLWMRTYRYLELDIRTKDAGITIDDLQATYVGYPFERRARFEAGSPEIGRILDTGWRTARLCAHETYMDCPYYEQLQYVGDTRVQCLVSLFNTGDARLMRNAIALIDNSREGESCTMSRYPTRLEQYIPGFSLWWIAMVHDYWWYVDDPAFARSMVPGVRSVLSFFEGYQKANGSLGPLPWWRFFDWAPEWPHGDAPGEPDGGSALFDLLLLMAYGWAADLEAALGLPAMADVYRGRERLLRETTQNLYWDEGKRLYADTPRKRQFSQHANTLAVLGGAITGEPARELMLRILTAPGLAQTQLYFRYYLHVALAKAGEGGRYLDQLGDWRAMLALGLTTFSEWLDRPGDPARSDCHAWSASPNIEIFRTVLGVDSAAPGFGRVSVRPHLGNLESVSGAVPHPRGMIEVHIDPQAANITLPAGVTGEFVWRGRRYELAPGSNRV